MVSWNVSNVENDAEESTAQMHGHSEGKLRTLQDWNGP